MKIQFLAISLLVLTVCVSCVKEGPRYALPTGERIPQFELTLLDGTEVSSGDLLGRPTVLVFFSTTCPDCHRQLPENEDVWLAAGDDVNVLAIARDEGPEAVRKHWTENSYTMPVSAPGDRTVYDLFDRGSQSGVPLLFISDAQGVVRHTADDSAVLTAQEMTRILSNIK